MDKKPETIDEVCELIGEDTVEILRDLCTHRYLADYIFDWLDKPIARYDNKTPYEIFKEDGEDKQKLKDYLYACSSGDYFF